VRGENRNVPRKTSPRSTLNTTNLTRIGPGTNPGLHDVKSEIRSLKCIHIEYISKPIFYLTENTVHLYCKAYLVNVLKEKSLFVVRIMSKT
jgi:hypothetical protein